MTTATHDPQALSTTVIDRGVLPTTEVVARVHRIQDVMRTLMKNGVHYGTIPGTPKPTLYKPGAELLLMTFRVAPTPAYIDDLSTADEVRYRVTMRGTNQATGEMLGEMVGECSSSEQKYRWARPVCDQEWDETDPARRREKWMKGSSGPYKAKQIRTSPADVANTILKMAVKRACIALTLAVLAASDIFAQDIEDLAEELRESIAEEPPSEPKQQPQRRSQAGNGGTTTQAASPAQGTAKALPANAKFSHGVIGRIYEDKKPFAVYLDGSNVKYTTFDDAVWADVKVFAGTKHQIRLAYVESTKDGRTYANVVGVSIADDPKRQKDEPPLTAGDIFGGSREPGEDD